MGDPAICRRVGWLWRFDRFVGSGPTLPGTCKPEQRRMEGGPSTHVRSVPRLNVMAASVLSSFVELGMEVDIYHGPRIMPVIGNKRMAIRHPIAVSETHSAP
jgi:hypothetical protein